jgi:hypothetical protein
MSDLLAIYLNDHLAAAAGSVALIRRVAGARTGQTAVATRQLAQQMAEDRDSLASIAQRLGVRRTFYKEPLALVAERLGRLKPNGALIRRSPLSDVVEYEALALAIAAKRAAWRTLRELAATRPELDSSELDALISRADDQASQVERFHGDAIRQAFAQSS